MADPDTAPHPDNADHPDDTQRPPGQDAHQGGGIGKGYTSHPIASPARMISPGNQTAPSSLVLFSQRTEKIEYTHALIRQRHHAQEERS
jgi:hypothetical protein